MKKHGIETEPLRSRLNSLETINMIISIKRTIVLISVIFVEALMGLTGIIMGIISQELRFLIPEAVLRMVIMIALTLLGLSRAWALSIVFIIEFITGFAFLVAVSLLVFNITGKGDMISACIFFALGMLFIALGSCAAVVVKRMRGK